MSLLEVEVVESHRMSAGKWFQACAAATEKISIQR